jgi:hypothetical protein
MLLYLKPMRRLIYLLSIGLALVLSSSEAFSREPVAAVVLTEGLTISNAPEGSSLDGQGFARGSLIEVLQMDVRNPLWVKVRVNGQEGYMPRHDLTSVKKYRKYVGEPFQARSLGTPVQPSGPYATMTPSYVNQQNLPPLPADAKPKLYVKATGLNLRSADSTAGDSYGIYPNGTMVEVLGHKNNWVNVRVDGQEGWMREDYLSMNNPNGPAPVALIPPPSSAAPGAGNDLPALIDPPKSTPLPASASSYADPNVMTPAAAPVQPQAPVPPMPVGNVCISDLTGKNAEQKALVAELQRVLGTASLRNSSWSGGGNRADEKVKFNLTEVKGGIIVQLTQLPEKAVKSIEDSFWPIDPRRGMVRSTIAKGNFLFSAGICKQPDGTYMVNLVGTGATNGNLGSMTIYPSNGHGFEMAGRFQRIQIQRSSYVAQ